MIGRFVLLTEMASARKLRVPKRTADLMAFQVSIMAVSSLIFIASFQPPQKWIALAGPNAIHSSWALYRLVIFCSPPTLKKRTLQSTENTARTLGIWNHPKRMPAGVKTREPSAMTRCRDFGKVSAVVHSVREYWTWKPTCRR